MAPAIALAIVGAVLVVVGTLAAGMSRQPDVRIIGATLLICGSSVLMICLLGVLPLG